MKLEDQVPPLRLAMQMKDMGCPQDTLYAWFVWPEKGQEPYVVGRWFEHPEYKGQLACAAPTVAEMGEWLVNGARVKVETERDAGKWRASVGLWGIPDGEIEEMAEEGSNEAHARAALIVMLCEKGIVDPRAIAGPSTGSPCG